MIKTGREHGKGAPAAADLLVCFPSRTHLRLMPKPICSPARPPEQSNKRLHHLKKSGSAAAGGQASPLMWAKSKSFGGAAELVSSEPTSPKVTCSGQIKVRHKGAAVPCKSWQSVMEEIEKMHKTNTRRKINNGGGSKKRSGWAEALGLKKEVMQFLTCLRTIRLDLRCFGSFPGGADVTTDDEDDDEVEEEEEEVDAKNEAESSRTVFSKWFMVLQEERSNTINNNDRKAVHMDDNDGGGEDAPAVPPPNALLLMRCRSAPAKSWLEEREEEEREREETSKIESKRSLRYLMAEDEKRNVVLMKYEYDEVSSDIAKETWLVGGLTDHLARCRSWKR